MTTPKELYYRKMALFYKTLSVLFFLIIALMTYKGIQKEAQLHKDEAWKNVFYEQAMAKDTIIDNLMLERTELQKSLLNSKLELRAVQSETQIKLRDYENQSREYKKQLVKRFQKTPVTVFDTNLVCLDSLGQDSLNKYVIDAEGKKQELEKSKATISLQEQAMAIDSAVISNLTEKSSNLEQAVAKERQQAKKQEKSKKFWRNLAVWLGVTTVSVITTLLLTK